MNFSNATTTMAPSAVITSQRNSVQRDWEKARDRDEETLVVRREMGRERAETESLYSCGPNTQGIDKDEERIASSGKFCPRNQLSVYLNEIRHTPYYIP